MKKTGILNGKLEGALTDLRHGDGCRTAKVPKEEE